MDCGKQHWRKDCPYENVKDLECKTKGQIHAICKKCNSLATLYKKVTKNKIFDSSSNTNSALESCISFLFHNYVTGRVEVGDAVGELLLYS